MFANVYELRKGILNGFIEIVQSPSETINCDGRGKKIHEMQSLTRVDYMSGFCWQKVPEISEDLNKLYASNSIAVIYESSDRFQCL
jgi:hypothetical protein